MFGGCLNRHGWKQHVIPRGQWIDGYGKAIARAIAKGLWHADLRAGVTSFEFNRLHEKCLSSCDFQANERNLGERRCDLGRGRKAAEKTAEVREGKSAVGRRQTKKSQMGPMRWEQLWEETKDRGATYFAGPASTAGALDSSYWECPANKAHLQRHCPLHEATGKSLPRRIAARKLQGRAAISREATPIGGRSIGARFICRDRR